MPFYYGWVVVFAAGTTVFARMAPSVFVLGIFLSPIADEFGWSRTLIAGAVSVGAVASMVLSPIIGWAVDRYGAGIILTVSMVVLGVAVISLAWATVPLFFYLGFATGRIIFHVPVQIGSGAVVSRWFIRKRGRAIGVLYLSGAIGGIVCIQIASIALSNWGIGAAWVALGVTVLGVAVLPSALLIVDRPEDVGLEPDGLPSGPPESMPVYLQLTQDPIEIDWTLREAMGTKSLWIMVGVVGTLFMTQAGVSVHIGAFYQDRGLGITAVASAITINGIVSGIGSLVWGAIIERAPVQRVMVVLMVLSATSTFLLFTVHSLAAAFAVSAVIGVVAAGGNVIPPVAYASYFGRRSIGSIRGIGETGVQVGQTIGPLLSGLAFDINGSYKVAFLTFAIVALIGSVVIATASPPSKPNQFSSP
ncbi:MAG TPA: MFS transporter [Dehalococcoidia bacterium]|nr:MFS transporter [Dehalococcoidia bacterium]HIL30149.1 MFS transporter [Dehalococcoidia bacterium]